MLEPGGKGGRVPGGQHLMSPIMVPATQVVFGGQQASWPGKEIVEWQDWKADEQVGVRRAQPPVRESWRLMGVKVSAGGMGMAGMRKAAVRGRERRIGSGKCMMAVMVCWDGSRVRSMRKGRW